MEMQTFSKKSDFEKKIFDHKITIWLVLLLENVTICFLCFFRRHDSERMVFWKNEIFNQKFKPCHILFY